jgi:hypothetical protein
MVMVIVVVVGKHSVTKKPVLVIMIDIHYKIRKKNPHPTPLTTTTYYLSSLVFVIIPSPYPILPLDSSSLRSLILF